MRSSRSLLSMFILCQFEAILGHIRLLSYKQRKNKNPKQNKQLINGQNNPPKIKYQVTIIISTTTTSGRGSEQYRQFSQEQIQNTNTNIKDPLISPTTIQTHLLPKMFETMPGKRNCYTSTYILYLKTLLWHANDWLPKHLELMINKQCC